MSPMFWTFVAIFLVADLIVVTLTFLRLNPVPALLRFTGGASRSQVLKSVHEMVGEYLRANYSGDVAQLPNALSGLMPKLRDLLRSQGVTPEPEMLRALVEMSAARHRVATLQQLREALAIVG